MPRMAAANWPMISGFSGLPKFMLSVIASGRAPTAVRLRQASATAWAAAGFRVGGAIARRAVGGERQGAVQPVQLHHGGVGRAGALHGLAADVLSYWSQTQAREHRSGQATSFSSARARPRRSSIRAGLSLVCFAGLGGGAV